MHLEKNPIIYFEKIEPYFGTTFRVDNKTYLRIPVWTGTSYAPFAGGEQRQNCLPTLERLVLKGSKV